MTPEMHTIQGSSRAPLDSISFNWLHSSAFVWYDAGMHDFLEITSSLGPAPVRSDLLVTTRQAAEICGVHASTVKRWCDAGELACEHTPGGHRRIGLNALLDFTVRQGHATDLDPFGPHAAAVWMASNEAMRERRLDRFVELWLGWLLRDEPAYLTPSMAYLLDAGLPLTALFDAGVNALLRQVGAAWYDGTLRIGDEHRVTEQVQDALHALRLQLALPRPAEDGVDGVAIVASAPGNRHHLGAFMARILLETRGWSVRYLGADLPADELAAQQRRAGACLVCVSFSAPQTLADARRLTQLLATESTKGQAFHLVLGGNALPPEAARIEAEGLASFQALPSMAAFEAWLERRFPGPRSEVQSSRGGRR